jgi:hypothetical protein
LIIALTSSSLYAACFIQIVFRVTGAGGADVAGAALLAAAVGAVLAAPVLGAGVVDDEQAANPIATLAKSARDLRAPA